MNKRLETLLERVSTWPAEAQAELMQTIVEIEARHTGVYRLSDEERSAVRRGLQELREGKFATDEQVAKVFGRHSS
jgi:predicted transcriptional regulator